MIEKAKRLLLRSARTMRGAVRGCVGPARYPLCLLFHRVAEVPEDDLGLDAKLCVKPDEFEAIISYVSDCCHPVSIQDLVEALRWGRRLPPRSVVVTFDDGYMDNWTTAVPILRRNRVPATIYVTTSFISGEDLPFERHLVRILARREHVCVEWGGRKIDYEIRHPVSRRECYEELRLIGKRLDYSDRVRLLEKVADGKEPGFRNNELFMTWQQVKDCEHDSLITIGAHTHRHCLLPSLGHRSLDWEIKRAKKELESRLCHPVKHFSYPYGGTSVEVEQSVTRAGFGSAVTTRARPVDLLHDNSRRIPRLELKKLGSFRNCINVQHSGGKS